MHRLLDCGDIEQGEAIFANLDLHNKYTRIAIIVVLCTYLALIKLNPLVIFESYL